MDSPACVDTESASSQSVCVGRGACPAALAAQQTAEGAGEEAERTEGLLLKHAAQVGAKHRNVIGS
jgi:hypothetical protein